MGANVNVTTHYPYSEKYVYETTMEIMNLDEERVKDITTGNGFIISAPLWFHRHISPNKDNVS